MSNKNTKSHAKQYLTMQIFTTGQKNIAQNFPYQRKKANFVPLNYD